MAPQLRILTAAIPDDPILDTAIGSALLAEVADGAPPAFRLTRPPRMVSFGRLDRLSPRFDEAVAAARRHGFAATMRVGGGRAAAVTEDAVDFGLATPSVASTTERFAAMTELVRAALARVGVRADVGELPGEYCPGAWSLHAGATKLVGISQRVVRGAAWTEGFLIAGGGDRIRAVLADVYGALEIEWDPGTAGDLATAGAPATWGEAAMAIRAELADRYELIDEAPSQDTVARARALRARHDPAPRGIPARGPDP
jgi:octanoyl-[GcvH]:protein N-octanoyltransferase